MYFYRSSSGHIKPAETHFSTEMLVNYVQVYQRTVYHNKSSVLMTWFVEILMCLVDVSTTTWNWVKPGKISLGVGIMKLYVLSNKT